MIKESDENVATIRLKLDIEQATNEDHPRRLLPVPVPSIKDADNSSGKTDSTVLTYGGSTGLIAVLTVLKASDPSVPVDLNTDCLSRRWDDDEDIRAVAVSNPKLDATESRVALGFDSGCTLFLLYDHFDEKITEHQKHPFVVVSDDDEPKCRKESGPSFAAPVRDIQFHPQCSDWVVVATEEGVCMLRFQFSSSEATYTKYFQEEANKAHDGSGVRCVCFSPNGDIVASLGMDGRLCLWYVSLQASSDDLKPHRNWTLIHRDTTRCITKRDTGEILGADPLDRSCRPYFLSDTLLVLPGETYLQFRHIHKSSTDGKASWVVNEQVESTKGHVESIVTFTSLDNTHNMNHKFLIATGRDKRITLWDVDLKSISKVKSCDYCL